MDMLSELEKIDVIRERTGVGYAEAKQLLDACDNDVVSALIMYEEQYTQPDAQQRLVAALERLVRQGNITRLRVRKGERTYLELPVTAGVIGAAIAPQLLLVASIACLVGRCSVDFQRSDDGNQNGWHEVAAHDSPAT